MTCKSLRTVFHRLAVIIGVATLLSAGEFASFTFAQGSPAKSLRTEQEENIREAVIRIQMERWYHAYDEQEHKAKEQWERDHARKMNFRVFLVSVNGKDPSAEFLARFKSIPRQIKKGSLGYFEKEPSPGWLHDRESHRRAIEFNVGTITWRSEYSAEIDGGYYCGGLCAARYLFKVQWVGNSWVVKETELKMIS